LLTRNEKEKERIAFEKLMDRLWLRLQEIYGHQLNSQYGEIMPESWERLLTGITPEQIASGLNKLADRSETWPPNAAEFRQLCLPDTISPDGKNSRAYINFNDPSHPDYQPKRIESDSYKERKKKAGKDALSKMKSMF